MEFSFSMDATPRAPTDANAPLFASVLGSAADLGGGECVFRTRDEQTHLMTHQVLQALDRCRSFLSLAEHTQAVRQVIPSAPAEGIARVIDSLVTRRLLISEQDFIAAMQERAQRTSPAPMQMLLRVGDRIEASARLLQSLAETPDWRDHVAQITLLSSSSSAGTRAQHKAQLEALGNVAGCPTRLIDAVEWHARIRKLAGADSRLVHALDLLIGTRAATTAGQMFNLALPLLAGKRNLLLDEHAQWPLHRHAEFRRGMDLRPVEQVSARFFAAQSEAMAAGVPAPQVDGLLREHDLACGASLGSLLDSDRSSVWKAGDLRGVALSEFLVDVGDIVVAGTISGARGAPRSLSTEDLFLLDAQSRASFNSDRELYLAQLRRGSLWSGARRTGLTQQSMDLPLTLDARDFMPFALPFAGSAGLGFSSMMRTMRPQTVFAHLPDSIGHIDGGRGAAEEVGKQASTPDFNRFVADFLAARAGDIRAHVGADRMQTAAALLRDLAQSSPKALNAYASEYLQFVRSDLINRLQRIVEEAGPDAPLHWIADLRAIVTVNGRALVQTQVPQLHGDASNDAAGFASGLAKRLRQTADAMEAWPILWERIVDESNTAKGALA
ncbi:MAG: hypothetical protein SGI99_17400 [Pseudomonadota bacterium]|nr:hypothetical protein [Pseudomonadota bacterium]